MQLSFFLVLVFSVYTLADVARFDNYKVYRLTPENDEQLKQLHKIQESGLDLDFWKEVSGKNVPVDIMVPPHKRAFIQDIISSFKINATIYIDNVQSVIDETSSKARAAKGLDWNNYYPGSEINAWLRSLAETYPDKVTLLVGGHSYEGRAIYGVKLSFGPGKKAVMLEGGIHAREWIGPATVTYILNELLTSKDAEVRDIAESYDWYVFPSVNPDGYEYTFQRNRLWRKTRQPYGLCVGADPNRNWDFHWMDGGASSNPCTETFAGSKAFSEPCTRSGADFITTVQPDLVAYIAFHSYSQFLLIPYGYTNQHLDNYQELMTIGKKAAQSLARRYGTQYVVGNIVDVIYVASGGSMDWVKGKFHTPITYTYELRDTGRYGFLLPPDQIIPTGEETLDSVVTIMQEARSRGYK